MTASKPFSSAAWPRPPRAWAWPALILFGAISLLSSIMALAGAAPVVSNYVAWGYPSGATPAIGAVSLVATLLLAWRQTCLVGAAVLALLWGDNLRQHFLRHEATHAGLAIAALALLAMIVVDRRQPVPRNSKGR